MKKTINPSSEVPTKIRIYSIKTFFSQFIGLIFLLSRQIKKAGCIIISAREPLQRLGDL